MDSAAFLVRFVKDTLPLFSDCRYPEACVCAQNERCFAAPPPSHPVPGVVLGLGGAMMLADSGDRAEDIIQGLERMGARGDVRLSAYEINRLLRQRGPDAQAPKPLVLHIHTERALTGMTIACHLTYDLIHAHPAIWWQVSTMLAPMGGGPGVMFCASQELRDRVLDLMRSIAGGVSSDYREIVPRLPTDDDLRDIGEREQP